MTKEQHKQRITAAIEKANEKCPGLIRWSDLRFEFEKERSRKVTEIAKQLLNDLSLEDLAVAYLVVLEGEQSAQQAPETQSSTADFVAPPATTKLAKKPGKRKKKDWVMPG